MNATVRRLSVPILALVVLLLAAVPVAAQPGTDLGNDGVDRDCADFVEQNAPQSYFTGDGGSAARNVDELDNTRNGVACEAADQQAEGVDTDGDGLTDTREAALGTALDRADTDGDGTNDGAEVTAGTDPTDPSSAPGGGPGPGDLLVQAFVCPAGYAGTDYVGRCGATPNVAFSTGPAGGEVTATATTGANGAARFDDLGTGAFVVSANLPGANLARVEIFCAAPGDTEPRAIERAGLTGATVQLVAGQRLTCSFYIVPAATGQPSASPSAAPSAAPWASARPSTRPTTLPNTGAGRLPYEGGSRQVIPFVLGATLLTLLGGLALCRCRHRA